MTTKSMEEVRCHSPAPSTLGPGQHLGNPVCVAFPMHTNASLTTPSTVPSRYGYIRNYTLDSILVHDGLPRS